MRALLNPLVATRLIGSLDNAASQQRIARHVPGQACTPECNHAGLLPADVVVVTGTPHQANPPLHPQEEAHIARQGMGRKRESDFRAGRACARAALAQFDIHDFALLPDAARAPRWPPGMVGSITHCEGACTVAVADVTHYAGIGIDAEVLERINDQIATVICTRAELRQLACCQAEARDRLLGVLFSAKESVFKAVFSATRQSLEFGEVELVIDFTAGRFAAHAMAAPPLNRILAALQGTFAIDLTRVMTAAWLTA